MSAQSMAAFMVLVFVAVWASAEYYVRRGRALDTARATRGLRGLPRRRFDEAAPGERPYRKLTSYPTGSGPYR